MNRWFFLGTLCLGACSPETETEVAEEDLPVQRPEREVIDEAKLAAKAAFERLSGELSQAIAEGGTVHAIPFCSSNAGSLTAEVAEAHGVKLVRLSDRPRNPEQRATGEDLEALQSMRDERKPHLSWNDDGTAVVRLPITISNPLCLTCHGGETEVTDETRRVLTERYPDDEATGYSMDDLRGVWRIEVPPKP